MSAQEIAYTGHDAGQYCNCVGSHNPNPMELHRHHIWPLGEGGPATDDNVVWLCPTSHVNVHELFRAWIKYEGEPPWEIRKFFGPFIRELAARGYQMMLDGAAAND